MKKVRLGIAGFQMMPRRGSLSAGTSEEATPPAAACLRTRNEGSGIEANYRKSVLATGPWKHRTITIYFGNEALLRKQYIKRGVSKE